MPQGPLDQLRDLLPDSVRQVVERETPIPSISGQAGAIAARNADLVRADIGQIVEVEGEDEVLYGPPPGLPQVRAALAETWNLTYGLDQGPIDGLPTGLSAENITMTTGAAEALSLVFKCFAKDAVVGLPIGHWENYENGVDLAGGRTVDVAFFDGQGRLDFAGLERSIRSEGIRLLVCNFPANPTGAVLEDSEYRELAAFLRQHDLMVVADEVYNRLRYDGKAPRTLLSYIPERVVVASSASKEYLIPGARVGFALCANPVMTNQVLPKLVRASTGSANVLGQRRLLDYLEAGLQDLRSGREPAMIVKLRAEMARRRDGLVETLAKHGMSPRGRPKHAPEGTIFLMAGLPDWWDGDDAAFADAALSKELFSCIPGSAFGIPGAVRFSFGAMTLDSISRLDAALTLLR